MKIHSYIKFEKKLRITPEKLEESGKILGKDMWVMDPLKRNTVGNGCLKERLYRLNKWLE